MKRIVGIFESGGDRYQPDRTFTYDYNPAYKLNQRRLAALVGLAAMGLPVILYMGTRIGASNGTCFYPTISHFYYAQFLGGIFIAILVFIGAFLLVYRGQNPQESRLATIAGFSALSAALFPTSGRGCTDDNFSGRAFGNFNLEDGNEFVTIAQATTDDPYFQLFPFADTLHLISATILFLFMAYYSFWVFTRIIDDDRKQTNIKLTNEKRSRNRLYFYSGWIIVVAMMIMFGRKAYEWATDSQINWWDDNHLTFWLEGISLWAFGFSWLVKGRFFDMILMDDSD